MGRGALDAYNSVCVVVPTIRPDLLKEKFLPAWEALFDEHGVRLLVVNDGEHPEVVDYTLGTSWGIEEMGKDADLIYNFNDGVRNLGFAYIAKNLPEVEYIISLDDDLVPIEDTIQDHLDALNQRVPVSWISPASEYMRGFPYGVREEAEVVLSHGIWWGIKDYDAPTQLVKGNPDVEFYTGPIPKGTYFPFCGMNVAFKRKMLPYMYWAPMGPKVGLDRFADIWLGIVSKRIIDEKGWAVVTGYASVFHERASNVFKNLVKEAKGLGLNENFWEGKEDDSYFTLYRERRRRWEKFIEGAVE